MTIIGPWSSPVAIVSSPARLSIITHIRPARPPYHGQTTIEVINFFPPSRIKNDEASESMLIHCDPSFLVRKGRHNHPRSRPGLLAI